MIFCAVLLTCSVATLGHVKTTETDPDLLYKVESRFIHTITKEDLFRARSITDIVPKTATESVESYESVRVAVLDEEGETSKTGNSSTLSEAQLKLLRSTDYSTDFYIRANYQRKNAITGKLEKEYLVYYMTIVPEKQAEFGDGIEAVINYLKENSKEETAIIEQDQLRPGQVSFTVTKEGDIAKVKLNATSGYTSVDETLVELITSMPGKWKPATNAKGEKVDQEFVFFFGVEGC